MSAVSRSSAESGKAFDTDEDEPIGALPNGELDAISRFRREGIEQRGLGGDGHELHSAHTEPRDGLVAHDDQVRRRSRDENAAHLVGGGAEHGAPDADRERGQEHHEQESDERT